MADDEKIIENQQSDEQPLLDYAATVNGKAPEKKKKSLFGGKNIFKNVRKKAEVKVNAFVLFLLAAVLIVVTVFATFILADKFYYNGYALEKGNKVTFRDKDADSVKIAKFQDILDFINENYYTDYDINELIEGAINGVVEELEDPYSKYYSPDTMDEYISFVEGTYSGIGITVTKTDTGYLVEEVTADSPAAKAGVKVGETMTAINGESVINMEAEKFNSYLKTDGNALTVSFITADGKTVDRKITVAIIKEQTVNVKKLEGDLVCVSITQFVPGTADSFKFAIEKIVADKTYKGVVIDLRNNPGGYVDEASKVADMILPEGTVATAQNRKGETVKKITSDTECISIPIAVIINENTASAAELLAGAIRDFKYGALVGVKSYGKALAQINKKYENDGSGIVLSTSRYFTPSGECIDGVGITPSTVVELADEYKDVSVDKIPTGYDVQLYAAMSALGVESTEKITPPAETDLDAEMKAE
ncbi:MAG: S41 family peptidase [Ruminococcaceae bacterium]|nr:S41 family peptidase [Oscillospiraceae bacterium]